MLISKLLSVKKINIQLKWIKLADELKLSQISSNNTLLKNLCPFSSKKYNELVYMSNRKIFL